MADESPSSPKSRRDFIKASAAAVTAATAIETNACAGVLGHVKPFTGQPEPHDVVIIGSGFGAMVAATQLTGKVNSVLVLERGVFFTSPERPVPPFFGNLPTDKKIWTRDDYQYWATPDNDNGLREEFLKLVRLHRGGDYFANKQRVPLYNYSQFQHLDVLTANAVGGGSTIYSNVSLAPYRPNDNADCPVMSHWPVKLGKPDYDAAKCWMEFWRGKAAPIVTTQRVDPSTFDLTNLEAAGLAYLYLPRSRALKRAAAKLAATTSILEGWKPLDLQVFEHGVTATATLKDQRICERQGRCFLGCLPGARHTLNKVFFGGLLSSIENGKLKLRPRSNVRSVTKGPNNTWDVRYYDILTGNEHVVRASTVVFAAGVLGTVEILMRSRTAGLTLSDRLGHGFSTNGDFSGFVVDIPKVLKATNPPNPNKLVDNRVFPTKGPINTSHVTFQVAGGRLVNVEDAGIPPMFAKAAKNILKSANNGGFNFFEFIAQLFSRETERQTEHEMVEDTFWFNCMGDDGDPQKPFRDVGGKFGFSHDKLTLDYDPKDHPVFGAVEDLLKKFATAMDDPDKADGATPKYVNFPLWGNVIGSPKLVITHPLGGCIMGADASEGAVSTDGRLFSGPSGTATHKGLFVMDGSVSPGPVAVNPSLSIVALALRIADAIAADLNVMVQKYTC